MSAQEIIDAGQGILPIVDTCKLLGISRSSYYPMLVAAGANANGVSRYMGPAVGIAAQRRAPLATLRQLLDAGSNVGDSDRFGNTALHLAIKSFYSDGVRFLLDQGADPLATNSRGKSCHDVAKEEGGLGMIAAIEKVLKDSAN